MNRARRSPTREVESLDLLLNEAAGLNLTPAWIEYDDPLFWPEPRSRFVPACWRYDEIKTLLDAAGRLIDVRLATRRNFIMRNPIPGNNFATTNTLTCAYQMMLPGEVAPSHRHSAHALRLIVDGRGTYSTVNGVKMPMETGDVVLTPGWFWHGHGHDGDRPAYWIDGLDVPLMRLLEPVFFQEHPDRHEKIVSVAAASPFRFTSASITRGLDQARPDPEGFHGPRITLDAPDMPSMGLAMERLESGAVTRRQRSTADHVFAVVEGSGSTIINTERLTWKLGDAFAIPKWNKYEHHATTDSVLFDLSNEPLMRFAKYYRFEAD
jgi:gentisate 1,2-dioxygenase